MASSELPTISESGGIEVAFSSNGTEEREAIVNELEKLKEIQRILQEVAAEVVRLAEKIEQVQEQLEKIAPPGAEDE